MKNYVTTYDPFFDFFFPVSRKETNNNYLMDVDVIERKHHYEMKVNLPNVKKEDVKISLKDGYLTINASVTNEFENDDDLEAKYIIHERRYGNYSRSFYVGEEIANEDISAKLENGVLNVNIKKVDVKAKEKEHLIEIL